MAALLGRRVHGPILGSRRRGASAARASPYDLADLGYPPVRIETPAGRAEYARAQSAFAERAAPLRTRLVELCDDLLLTRAATARR